ncbi:hypothetical protein MNBD_ALPHA06-2318 [hydrothermal vent metagenome]|uniref:MAPEG family protein n=1 Tax=hydrothermal vent metagenome TaxID=652676 RepID=A0A3B0S6R4_9ZZZZ
MQNVQILTPVIVLAGWTMIILIWLYAKRIPAMSKAKIKPDDSLDQDLSNALPLAARQVAANYNHLLEQPPLFYAVCLAIAFMGHVDAVAIYAAWAYVILRILHSLVQCIYHTVMHRWALFMLSSLSLGVLVVNELIKLF